MKWRKVYMRKFTSLLLALACVLGLIGCNNQSAQNGNLLKDGNVTSIAVTSLPEGYDYLFSGDGAKAIITYLSNLNLDENFKENPNEYGGMTWVISLEYDSGDVLTVYHFGNMFIRTESGPWYKMTYEEASQFDSLLNELKN